MPDTVMLDTLCPSCGDAQEPTTLLWPDPEVAVEGGREILIERPGLWCRACGSAAPEALEAITVPPRRAA